MAQPVSLVKSRAAPMLEADIDTDIIIPSREMRSTGKTGLAAGLFAGRRYLAGGGVRVENPDFVLNRPEFREARILLAGANFGCGSSREHAVWALAEHGIGAVIAPSFSPIFAANAARGGVVPVVLPMTAVAALAAVETPVTVDLTGQRVTAAGLAFGFAIDAEARAMLLGGLDAIDLTFRQREAIAAWQARDRLVRPWAWLAAS